MSLLEKMVCNPPSSPTDVSKTFILPEIDLDPGIENIISVPGKKNHSKLCASTEDSNRTEMDRINFIPKFHGLGNLLLILSVMIMMKICLHYFVLKGVG